LIALCCGIATILWEGERKEGKNRNDERCFISKRGNGVVGEGKKNGWLFQRCCEVGSPAWNVGGAVKKLHSGM